MRGRAGWEGIVFCVWFGLRLERRPSIRRATDDGRDGREGRRRATRGAKSVSRRRESCRLSTRSIGGVRAQQPQIVLLREGTDSSQGRGQCVSNINACCAVADAVRTTLGPRGLDKLVRDERGNTTVSNDGATIMKLLEIVHPAAKTLVDIAQAQDSEVGDGTTTVVILAGELLKEAKTFIEDGVHPMNVIKSFREACALATARVKELSTSIEGGSAAEKDELLKKCAMTTLSSKLVGGEKEFFADMCVRAVRSRTTYRYYVVCTRTMYISYLVLVHRTGTYLYVHVWVRGAWCVVRGVCSLSLLYRNI